MSSKAFLAGTESKANGDGQVRFGPGGCFESRAPDTLLLLSVVCALTLDGGIRFDFSRRTARISLN
jgi:hypothetical protein